MCFSKLQHHKKESNSAFLISQFRLDLEEGCQPFLTFF